MQEALMVLAIANLVAVGFATRRRIRLQRALDRVQAQLEEWDRLSKGETPTTARIRAAINGAHTHPVPSGALHEPEDT